MKPTTKTELLKQIKREIHKEHVEFDGFGRPSLKYIAPVYASTGTPCYVVQYIYSPLYSSTIIGRKEGYTEWQSSFDNLVSYNLVDDLGNNLVDDLGNSLVEY